VNGFFLRQGKEYKGGLADKLDEKMQREEKRVTTKSGKGWKKGLSPKGEKRGGPKKCH